MIRKFQGIDYVPVIADIQDYDRLLQVFEQYKPAIVYHAAAHKHVPMMERNPKEAFKTISVEPTMLLRLLMKRKYLRWL